MKFKAKTKDCYLIVTAKMTHGDVIDERALDAFSRIYLRGFMRPRQVKKNVIEYSGPVAMSLFERLKRPLNKRDFLFILEQIVITLQKIHGNSLMLNKLVMDIHNVYINDVTKELQFLYVPTQNVIPSTGVMVFIESIVYSVIPATQADADTVSRFVYFWNNQPAFNPENIEKFVAREDPSVVSTLKKQNVGQSGFMTSKQKHYYDHYDQVNEEADNDATGLIEENDATALLEENDATGLLMEDDATGLLMEDDATGLLQEEQPAVYGDPEPSWMPQQPASYSNPEPSWMPQQPAAYSNPEPTWAPQQPASYSNPEPAWMPQQPASYSNPEPAWAPQQPTPSQPREESTIYISRNPARMPQHEVSSAEEEATCLLVEDSAPVQPPAAVRSGRYPTLFRIMTQETISINKPVFRLGKERSYVDYFVTNNNAVSRSHADIITRGGRYYVIDLNSKNHTYVNDKMTTPQTETELHFGDRLTLGNEEFIFQA